MKKILSIVLFYILLTSALVLYYIFHPSPIQLERGVYMRQPIQISNFKLMNHQGLPFTEANFKNHYTLLFFGFSHCERICPTALSLFIQIYERLIDKGLQVVFITVDPKRDSLERLSQFIHRFHKDFIGLRGPLDTIHAIQKQLHVSQSSTPTSHGTEIVLINPKAEVQAYFYFPISAKAILGDLNKLIK